MSPFKSRFSFRKGEKNDGQSLEVRDLGTAPDETREHGRGDSKVVSFYEGDFRNYPAGDVEQMRGMMMLEQLHAEQQRRLWCTSFGDGQGVILKHSKGKYAACPPSLETESGGLFDQVIQMNVRCAMTISTQIVQLFLSVQQYDDAALRNGLSIQILPNVEALPRCFKHQFAAFIREKQYLIIWDDEPENLMQRAAALEEMLLQTIWNDDDMSYGYEKRGSIDVSINTVPVEELENGSEMPPDDPEVVRQEPRRVVLWSPTQVAGTLMLICSALGLGLRALALEIAVDGKFIRLALLVTVPPLFFVGLFIMQSIIGSLMQMFGPVNQMMSNSKAYSGRPPPRIRNGVLPHITIQMPVYKEGLAAVIRPTVLSLKAAISTYELQGGTANIFVNDDGIQLLPENKADERKDFYEEHNIGWVARPKHNPAPKASRKSGDNGPTPDDPTIFVRKGKFKKASNMNFALNVSNKTEEKLAVIPRGQHWTQEHEDSAYKRCVQEVLQEMQGKAWASGNIRVGDYILLIDSDTRVPKDCLLDAASEMEASPEVAILQYSSGVMQITDSFFENGITFFTNLIYTAIRFAVSSGDVCPFVGHNAILRWSAIQQISYEDEDYEKFWSESHVSEDFDMALRLQCFGYSIRLGAYHGDGFKEGVSLTVYDELARWEKYAYGCNELLFHPVRLWFMRGPFTPLFKKFLWSNMPIGAKITIVSYIGTYYAIGAAFLLTLLNYFLSGWYAGYVDKFYMGSFQIYVSIVVVFSGLGNIALAVLRYRTSEKSLIRSLLENFKWILLLTIFLGGISLHVSQALLSHMFEIDMSWGATSKEVENTTFFEEMPKLLKKFKFTFIICFITIGLIIAGATVFPLFWRITTFNAIYPLCTVVASHILLPIALNPALMMFSW